MANCIDCKNLKRRYIDRGYDGVDTVYKCGVTGREVSPFWGPIGYDWKCPKEQKPISPESEE